jgi:ABC-type spermidine/putrescine transport system permease subunit II
VLLSAGVAGVVTIGRFVFGKIIAGHPQRARFQAMMYLPFAFSPVIYAYCLQFFFLKADLSGSVAGVLLAQGLLLPFGMLFFSTHWDDRLRAMEELAHTLGGTRRDTWRRVLIPVSKMALLTAFFQSFLLSWFDYGPMSVIGLGQVSTLSVLVWQFIGEADLYFVAIGSCLLVFPPAILLFINKKNCLSRYRLTSTTMKINTLYLLTFALLSLPACRQNTPKGSPAAAEKVTLPPAKSNYWYQGKAEVNSYTVLQERYGELREAGQVMVFVTEDFSKNKQVKLDGAPEPGDERLPVLKLNTLRRFQTGIYDYSVMQSVFTPMETEKMRTQKTTTTIQDWCGHVFVQCNASTGGYKVRAFSYFEKEGDTETDMTPDLLEDEIWTLLRLNPNALASRKMTVLPSVVYTRFKHKPLRPEEATFSVEKGADESVLRLAYTSIPRQLGIRFETAFPHRILGWEETDNGNLMSKGTLKTILLDAYWQHNDNASAPLRTALNPGF